MNFKIFLVTLVLMVVGGIKANNFTTDYKKVYDELNSKSLYQVILLYNIKFPEIVYAQAVLESSEFNSELFLRTNNLFGMKYPNVRKTTSSGKSEDGYAEYQHWTSSVTDYQIWQKNNMNEDVNSQSDYFNLLSKSYAEDKKYVNKLKNIISRNNDFFDSIK